MDRAVPPLPQLPRARTALTPFLARGLWPYSPGCSPSPIRIWRALLSPTLLLLGLLLSPSPLWPCPFCLPPTPPPVAATIAERLVASTASVVAAPRAAEGDAVSGQAGHLTPERSVGKRSQPTPAMRSQSTQASSHTASA